MLFPWEDLCDLEKRERGRKVMTSILEDSREGVNRHCVRENTNGKTIPHRDPIKNAYVLSALLKLN